MEREGEGGGGGAGLFVVVCLLLRANHLVEIAELLAKLWIRRCTEADGVRTRGCVVALWLTLLLPRRLRDRCGDTVVVTEVNDSILETDYRTV